MARYLILIQVQVAYEIRGRKEGIKRSEWSEQSNALGKGQSHTKAYVDWSFFENHLGLIQRKGCYSYASESDLARMPTRPKFHPIVCCDGGTPVQLALTERNLREWSQRYHSWPNPNISNSAGVSESRLESYRLPKRSSETKPS